VNRDWEIAEFEHRPHGWQKARRFVVARRFIEAEEAETTLFAMGRYVYRAWVTNLPLTPAGIWYFYDGRAGMEPRIRELREDFALRKIPTGSFAANALFLYTTRLQLGHCVSEKLSRRLLATSHVTEAPIQVIHDTRRTNSPQESSCAPAQTLIND